MSLARPRVGRIRIQPWLAGLLGASLSLISGLVPPELIVVALKLLLHPLLTIVSLMIITLITDRAGLFDLVARAIARAAGGSGRRLFSYIFACGTVTGMLCTNDAAVLIFTPLVFELVERIQGPAWTLREKIPFYFAVLYVANLVGALVTSNPINIVVASLFHIPFLEYARWMFLPAVASMLVTFAGLAIVFRNSVPRTYIRPERARHSHDRRQLTLCAVILTATLVGFFLESVTGVPTWLVALAGAIVLLAVHKTIGRGDLRSVMRGVSWGVLVFVMGIFVVVLGLRRVGLTQQIGGALARLAVTGLSTSTIGTGLIAATCSSILNNHPTAYMMSWAIRDLSIPVFQMRALAFAALIGGDLGPKMLPIGSLAALIWFRLLRVRGVKIPYSLYIKIGIPVTLAAILAAVVTLNIELALVARHSGL